MLGIPRRTVMVVALSALGSAPVHAQQIEEAELVRRLSAHVDSAYERGEFSGVVLLARNGVAVLERAYGLADRTSGRQNETTTAFNLGSINKLFTRIGVLQLAAAGRIHLDSTLAHHWPDYPNPDVARRITIRQLLEHSSGIGGNIFGTWEGGTREMLRSNADFMRLFASEPLQFEPGTREEYSNAGYVVLGEMIARASGMNYYDYVARHVYAPAGLVQTAHFAKDSLPAHAAIGYLRNDSGELEPNTAQLPGRGSAAGGGYSTAQDLLRFLNALRGRQIPNGPGAGIGVAGGAPGTNAIVEGALPGGYDLIVLANFSPPAAQRIGRTFRGWLGAED